MDALNVDPGFLSSLVLEVAEVEVLELLALKKGSKRLHVIVSDAENLQLETLPCSKTQISDLTPLSKCSELAERRQIGDVCPIKINNLQLMEA